MRTLILTLGSRGDLEYFLLLARTLRDRGHTVHVITSHFHAHRVAGCGIECTPVSAVSAQGLEAILASLVSEPDLRIRTRKYVEQFLRPELDAARPALATLGVTSDYFVNNVKIALSRQGSVVPAAFVTYDPPAALDELDLYTAKLPRERILELAAFPQLLIDPHGRWPSRFVFTGFWLAPDDATALSAEVERFLCAGSPPVVLTMGSMRMFDAGRLANTFADALLKLGMRGVFVTPSQQTEVSGFVLYVAEIPYRRLFPRASAVIHHGGVGTTAEVMRAGKPSIVLPQILAQKHMADLLTTANVCAGSFNPVEVSVSELSTAIAEAVNNSRFILAAEGFRKTIGEDSGVLSAASEIERHWRTITAV